MKCPFCKFDMTAEVIDNKIINYECPLGHKKVGIIARSYTPRVESTYPANLEHK